MNQHLQNILDIIQQNESLPAEQKDAILKSLKNAGKEIDITAFKLDRTEKVKRTTAILLEETIEELEQKRKAVEAQNRNLEIEASLERVRTIAMGMSKPEDLLNISKANYTELTKLGFAEIRNSLIGIFHDDKSYFTDYDYSDFSGGSITNIPYNKNSIIDKSVQQMKSATDAFTEFMVEGTELEAWKAFREQNGEYEDTRLKDTNALYYYFYSIEQGNVGISTFKKISEEQLNILKRFRNVFDLAYKRYVDISNAEAQAKEARIEAGLERVRSRSMAMHHTSELQEVIHTVHKELLHLNIAINGGSFIAINDDIKTTLRCWGSGGTADTSAEVHLPLYEKPFCSNLIKGIKNGPGFFTEEYSQEDKKEFFTFLFEYEPWSALDAEQKKETLLSPGGYTRSCCVSKHTSIFIINHFGEKFSASDNEILKRFGKVFDQTYTRFLDLQKAEAQAREAQIEAALERVRSRTMAMQHSDELAEASFVLDSQIRSLGIQTRGCAFNIYRDNESTEWFSSEMGTMPTYKTPRENIFLRYYEAGKAGAIMHIEAFEGDACAAHYNYLCTLPVMGDALKEMIANGGSFPVRQTDHVVYFKYGYLLFITYDPVPESHEIFIRFTKVFEQTYTRFLDLQKAEAQAIRAEQDLIAIKEAKQKAEEAFMELQATQKQLIQSEKMASLGELTAGIAHEIQNPLNFVNNFSDLSGELIDEMNEELNKGDIEEAKAIAIDVKQNLEKINHHGKRADAIVKGMLQHSRSSSATKEPTGINKLADEYLRLAYHARLNAGGGQGLRAKDNAFNALLKTDFDATIGNINIIPQDIGRVLLNLFNNAFYAITEKQKTAGSDYQPTVSISTKNNGHTIELTVSDNGNGIPAAIKEKIFQPFFTTKPTGQGTGLGLSLSYDIVKAHGGEIRVVTEKDKGTQFIVQLPI